MGMRDLNGSRFFTFNPSMEVALYLILLLLEESSARSSVQRRLQGGDLCSVPFHGNLCSYV